MISLHYTDLKTGLSYFYHTVGVKRIPFDKKINDSST